MSIDASTLIILGFGALLIIGGALIVRIYTSRVNRCSIKLIGVIKDVDYEEGYDSADRKEYRYFPVVGYYFEGTYYQNKSDAVCSYNENEYVEGAEIAIRVNPENPKDLPSPVGDDGVPLPEEPALR